MAKSVSTPDDHAIIELLQEYCEGVYHRVILDLAVKLCIDRLAFHCNITASLGSLLSHQTCLLYYVQAKIQHNDITKQSMTPNRTTMHNNNSLTSSACKSCACEHSNQMCQMTMQCSPECQSMFEVTR